MAELRSAIFWVLNCPMAGLGANHKYS